MFDLISNLQGTFTFLLNEHSEGNNQEKLNAKNRRNQFSMVCCKSSGCAEANVESPGIQHDQVPDEPHLMTVVFMPHTLRFSSCK